MKNSSEEPPIKIAKIDQEITIKIYSIIDHHLRSEKIPHTSFQALEFDNKRIIGKIIKNLDELPEELHHLKRVGKDGRMLVAKTREEAEKIVDKYTDLGVKNDNLTTVDVPLLKPITRKQFEMSKQMWPTSFHPDKSLESLLDGSFVTEKLRASVRKWSTKALEVGCVAVQNDKFLCEGSSEPSPLHHPVMTMITKMPKRVPSAENYLGTGCDVFLRNEPCAMCAMALVHFRVKRIYILHPSKNGVLLDETSWQLHLEPLINHHYEVFRVLFENQDRNMISVCS